MNVDTLKTYNTINSITHHLTNNNIDIACIQETHNNNDDYIIKNGYAIYILADRIFVQNLNLKLEEV